MQRHDMKYYQKFLPMVVLSSLVCERTHLFTSCASGKQRLIGLSFVTPAHSFIFSLDGDATVSHLWGGLRSIETPTDVLDVEKVPVRWNPDGRFGERMAGAPC